jgi:UDP-N-acetylmuramate--alanine ligase
VKDLKDIRNVYFIGIGGIGMSALARYFKSAGAVVSGYDKTRTPLTDELSEEGISVLFADEEASADPAADWVIYTPAIPAANKVLGYYRSHDYPLLKRSDVLGKITADTFNICIAGTHGKTTITTLIAHILRHSGYGSNAFLGGISVNYHTNFWSSERPVSVVEADEYDRSFLKLNPNIAVITAMDPDHLDIYGTAEAMEEAFIDFSARIRPEGWLLSKYGLKRGGDLKGSRHLTYHLNDTKADVHASGLTATEGTYTFNVVLPSEQLTGFVLHIGGLHNVENTLAAVAVAHSLGISAEAIKAAVADFKGVRRRFEYVLRTPEVVLVDDYAHHPEELRALISGAKGLFGGRKVKVVFQPHLFTRTRDLADGFAESLDLADEVVLLPIYPARELPIEGVSSEMIKERMHHARVKVLTKEELLEWAAGADATAGSSGAASSGGAAGSGAGGSSVGGSMEPSLVIMAGAGDIDALVHPVAEKLKEGR